MASSHSDLDKKNYLRSGCGAVISYRTSGDVSEISKAALSLCPIIFEVGCFGVVICFPKIWVIFFSIHFFCFHFPLHAKTIGILYYIIRRLYLITIQYMRIVDKIEKLSVWVLAVKNYMKIDRGHVSDIQYREI